MQKKKILKFALIATALLLIPRRSSKKADINSQPKTPTPKNNNH